MKNKFEINLKNLGKFTGSNDSNVELYNLKTGKTIITVYPFWHDKHGQSYKLIPSNDCKYFSAYKVQS